MAEGESASISENNKWGIKKRFLDGSYKLGYVPYGYRWKDGEIEADSPSAIELRMERNSSLSIEPVLIFSFSK